MAAIRPSSASACGRSVYCGFVRRIAKRNFGQAQILTMKKLIAAVNLTTTILTRGLPPEIAGAVGVDKGLQE